MFKKSLTTALQSAFIMGLVATGAQAHDGSGSGDHHVVDSSGKPVMSSAGCVVSSGSGATNPEACGGDKAAMEAKPAMAEPMAAAPVATMAPVATAATAMMAPVAVKPMKTMTKPMMKPVMKPMMKPAMGTAHSHPANRCTRSISHSHAGPGRHSHRYSCQGNKMASPRQVAR